MLVSRGSRRRVHEQTPFLNTRPRLYLTQVLEKSVLTAMPALRHLDVSHNLLCRMEPVDGRDLSPHLETLNMSHNRITRIGGIGQCFSLRVLDLSHNRIKVLDGGGDRRVRSREGTGDQEPRRNREAVGGMPAFAVVDRAICHDEDGSGFDATSESASYHHIGTLVYT